MRKSQYGLFLLIVMLFNVSLSWGFVAQTEEQTIKQLDLDLDGKIAIKEAVAKPQLLALFGRIDTDGDGLISRLELQQSNFVEQSLAAPVKAEKLE